MTTEHTIHGALTADDIRAHIRARRAELQPLVDEYRQLEEADQILDTTLGPLDKPITVAGAPAPYGYKADGTPRQRPGRKPKPA